VGAGAFEGLPGRRFAGVVPRSWELPVAGAAVADWGCEIGLARAAAAAADEAAVVRRAGC
jgi:hypothetical protein